MRRANVIKATPFGIRPKQYTAEAIEYTGDETALLKFVGENAYVWGDNHEYIHLNFYDHSYYNTTFYKGTKIVSIRLGYYLVKYKDEDGKTLFRMYTPNIFNAIFERTNVV